MCLGFEVVALLLVSFSRVFTIFSVKRTFAQREPRLSSDLQPGLPGPDRAASSAVSALVERFDIEPFSDFSAK